MRVLLAFNEFFKVLFTWLLTHHMHDYLIHPFHWWMNVIHHAANVHSFACTFFLESTHNLIWNGWWSVLPIHKRLNEFLSGNDFGMLFSDYLPSHVLVNIPVTLAITVIAVPFWINSWTQNLLCHPPECSSNDKHNYKLNKWYSYSCLSLIFWVQSKFEWTHKALLCRSSLCAWWHLLSETCTCE